LIPVIGELLAGDALRQLKGDAAASYLETLKEVWNHIGSISKSALEICRVFRERVLSAANKSEEIELFELTGLLAEDKHALEYRK